MTTAAEESVWLLPVGFSYGPVREHVGGAVDRAVVRVGWETVTIEDLSDWRLWHLVRVFAPLPDHAPSLERLRQIGAGQGFADLDERLERLIDAGLVVQIPRDDTSLMEFADAYRVAVLLAGLGQLPGAAPTERRVGYPQSSISKPLSTAEFEFWKWAPTAATVHAAALAYAGRPGAQEQLTDQAAIHAAVTLIRSLVARGAMYIDVAREPFEPLRAVVTSVGPEAVADER